MKVSRALAKTLLSSTSSLACSLHANAATLMEYLQFVCQGGAILSLHIRLRNDESTSTSLTPLSAMRLKHLSIYSDTWDISFLRFESIIRFIGYNLESLHLEEASPASLFPLLATYCPHLEHLTIDGEQPKADFQKYASPNLSFLRLHETQIDLSEQYIQLPALTRLEFIDSIEPIDTIRSITKLPFSLRELELQIDYRQADSCILTIGQVLFNLDNLILRLRDTADSDEDEDVEEQHIQAVGREAMQSLCNGCPHLNYFEIVDKIIGGLSLEAFLMLPEFAELEHVCIVYGSAFIEALPKVLSDSHSLTEVILFEDAHYFCAVDERLAPLSKWEVMCMKVESVAERFPSVDIELRDDSAWLTLQY